MLEEHFRLNRVPGVKRVTRKASQGLSRWIWDPDPYIKEVMDFRRDSHVQMTPELRARVRAYCAPGNRRLAELLGRDDLGELGY